LNDDATPMEFVVAVLERVFAMDRVVATRCMFEAHTHGITACGTYPPEVATARAAQVLDLAHPHGDELRCVVT